MDRAVSRLIWRVIAGMRGTLAMLVAVSLLIVAFTAYRAAEAQQSAKPYKVGFLSSRGSPGRDTSPDPYLAALLAKMRELGYSEGTNLRIEARSAGGNLDRLSPLAAEIVALQVDVILAAGNPAIDAARRATSTIPIVMVSADPVAAGFVRSLSRPDGNLTGLVVDAGLGIWGKRLELLKEAAPKIKRVAVLSRTGGQHGAWVPELERAAGQLGLALVHAGVKRPEDFPAAFDAIRAQRADALIASDTPLNLHYRNLIIEFTTSHRLPDVHAYREAAQDGALLSYGVDIVDVYRRAAFYVDRLLKGAQPADLPIARRTNFVLVINSKTARALGFTIPPTLLLQADQVIE